MSFELVFRTKARIDLLDIRGYYDNISATVSNNFFNEFFETLKFIEQEPKLFQVRYRGIRIAPLYRFPYGVHYIEKNTQIIILRVLHTKRYFK